MSHDSCRRTYLKASLVSLALATPASRALAAPSYPDRPVKLVVAFAAGGPIDLTARIIAEQLTKRLGQPFVVENRPGANGAIAAGVLNNSAPDGHTMLVSNASMITITPTIQKKLQYDVLRDFAPVTRVVASPLVLVVNPEDPVTGNVRSVDELVALAKTQPDRLTYGSAGLNGNVQQLAFELFADQAGISLVSVPYKGSSEAQMAVLSKTVHLSFDTLTALPYIKSGKMRRWPSHRVSGCGNCRDLPTMEELGYKGFDIGFWSGLFLPKATASSIVDKLSRTVGEAVNDPAVRARLEPLGTIVTSTPAEFAVHIQEEMALLAEVIKRAKISAE